VGEGLDEAFKCGEDLQVSGNGIKTQDFEGALAFVNIGTFDGTGPETSPVGMESGEVFFEVDVPADGKYTLKVEHINGAQPEVGSWLQVAADYEDETLYLFDDFFGEQPVITKENEDPAEKPRLSYLRTDLEVELKKGKCSIRLMNHRRQENTLNSYARLLKGLNDAAPDHDIIYSACEWGKTQPQNWGYKVCDSWRILNDITFRVGSDGDPGVGTWDGDYTTSVTTQYSKAVIMDEFAGLDKGWNDPDMLMIGMNGLDRVQNKTHMTMWAMMNSPLMLGLDLRRVTKGDELYEIIANKDIIALNQDALGVQAKRIYCSLAEKEPDKEYIRDIDRVDILAKPLSGDRLALSFINVSKEATDKTYSVDKKLIQGFLGDKLSDIIKNASEFTVKNLWTGEIKSNNTGVFEVSGLAACDNVTLLITPKA
jgi:alpha-galactosidase